MELQGKESPKPLSKLPPVMNKTTQQSGDILSASYKQYRLFATAAMLFLLIFMGRFAITAEGSGAIDAPQGEAIKTAKTVLVVYPTPRLLRGTLPWQERDWPVMLQNLLGHFDVEVTLRTSGEYQEGDLARYDAFVYMGAYTEKVPRALLRDVTRSQGPVMWLGRNIGQLAVVGGPRWQTRLSERQTITYTYKDKRLGEDHPVQWNLVEENPAESDVWAWADCPQGRYPFGLKVHRFWYVANTDLNSQAYLLVADQLFDFLGHPPEGKRWASLRIEDVHPLRSPEMLRQFADTLKSRNIPFMVTVVPVYINPKTGERVTLPERPEMVDALRYMEASGGTILVHGLTHQVGDTETGWGFEFWDADGERPVISRRYLDWAEMRWDRAINDLRALGLRPLGITVPHYAMQAETYRQLRDRVDLLVGCPQIAGYSRLTQKVPYLLKKDRNGYQVIPENIGFFDYRQADPVAPMLEAADEVALVRDCAVGAFFHSFLDSGQLAQLVDGLRHQGFTFLDARSLPVREVLPSASPERAIGAIDDRAVFSDPIVNGDAVNPAPSLLLGKVAAGAADALPLTGVILTALILSTGILVIGTRLVDAVSSTPFQSKAQKKQ
ncbi:DUF2334 domain-containing protein [Heliobacterium gestii]|uniref:DUF2334 domain-containing protein n=1 Tax=Heliomicrobium gestii TaxID=2699 RepID=A0A845L6E6_HELGE|nr:polysaccharide deacetylase family protein [Heliomicrobium gestii]MBM7866808.1 uncharacterized protein YdaL [Heliomicrobium gestii]MZP42237.1 DUF2334 domain-containing protein [Heliomicrobium gestii]